MVRQLRAGKGKVGLVLANGGVVTYENVVCLSSSPRRDGLPYPDINPLSDYVTDVQVPPVDEKAEGDATVEVRKGWRFLDHFPDLRLRPIPSSSTEMEAHNEVTSLDD